MIKILNYIILLFAIVIYLIIILYLNLKIIEASCLKDFACSHRVLVSAKSRQVPR